MFGASESRPLRLAADAPSRDELFGDDAAPKRESRDALFDGKPPDVAQRSPWRGFVRGELAYTYAEPEHWSKMLVRSELDAQGALTPDIKY